jgi:hypothetical protein
VVAAEHRVRRSSAVSVAPPRLRRVAIARAVLAPLIAAARRDPETAALVRQHTVLPLTADFMGWWVLTVTGLLGFVPHEAPTVLDYVTDHPADDRGAHVALAVGSQRYPSLRDICPVRGPDAIACVSCDGTGRFPGLPTNVLCICAGLGWYPRERYSME